MLIREDVTTQKAAVPVNLTAAFPVEVEALARTYHGTPIKSFIDLQPYANVQRVAIDAAKKWISHMRLQGYELIGNETEIELWGPYRPKSELYQSDTATSYTNDSNPFPDGKAKMLLTGTFLATKQYAVEA